MEKGEINFLNVLNLVNGTFIEWAGIVVIWMNDANFKYVFIIFFLMPCKLIITSNIMALCRKCVAKFSTVVSHILDAEHCRFNVHCRLSQIYGWWAVDAHIRRLEADLFEHNFYFFDELFNDDVSVEAIYSVSVHNFTSEQYCWTAW
jgi:hypothetical protein